jgi:hypothetical protein
LSSVSIEYSPGKVPAQATSGARLNDPEQAPQMILMTDQNPGFGICFGRQTSSHCHNIIYKKISQQEIMKENHVLHLEDLNLRIDHD